MDIPIANLQTYFKIYSDEHRNSTSHNIFSYMHLIASFYVFNFNDISYDNLQVGTCIIVWT